jgi:hypothetical protein
LGQGKSKTVAGVEDIASHFCQQRQKWGTGDCALIEAVELGSGLEMAVEVPVDDLHEEFAEVGEA